MSVNSSHFGSRFALKMAPATSICGVCDKSCESCCAHNSISFFSLNVFSLVCMWIFFLPGNLPMKF